MGKPNNIWWGPPRKFSRNFEERKISWLELFYDLVYVIVISRATHLLAVHPGAQGIETYIYLFSMIFWGWLNGSQYHDLHGSPGIRTRFMTLWQMVAVAALAVTLDSPPDKLIYRATISIAVLQFYITYLWWSVGIYDKHHRKLNVPYTVCYLLALAMIIATLYVPQPYTRILFWFTIVLNYAPPFFTLIRLRKINEDFTLSPAMVERLGLFATIVFGETILGVINGMSSFKELHVGNWMCFGLGILNTVALWWIFFSLIADRKSKTGFFAGSLMAITYIPCLASLGMVGASFPGMMEVMNIQTNAFVHISRTLYGVSLGAFLCCITAISNFLVYPQEYSWAKRLLQPLVVVAGVVVLLITALCTELPLWLFLLFIFIILLFIIIIITTGWFRTELLRLQEANTE